MTLPTEMHAALYAFKATVKAACNDSQWPGLEDDLINLENKLEAEFQPAKPAPEPDVTLDPASQAELAESVGGAEQVTLTAADVGSIDALDL